MKKEMNEEEMNEKNEWRQSSVFILHKIPAPTWFKQYFYYMEVVNAPYKKTPAF